MRLKSQVLRCYLCNSRDNSFLTSFYRGGRIFRCNYCLNAFTVPKPEFHYDKTEKFIFKDADHSEAVSYARPMLDLIKKFINKGKFLDVGCGFGVLVEIAQKSGFEAVGLEPSEQAVKLTRQRGLKVRKGYLKKGIYTPGSFSVVSLSHVLEHVEDAGAFLKIVNRLIKKNGFLFLAQTNYEGTAPGILGKYWEGWVTSQHYVHFSPKGIKLILEKNNFNLITIQYSTLGYRPLFRFGNRGVIANDFYYSFNWLLSIILAPFGYTGDQIFVLARKK